MLLLVMLRYIQASASSCMGLSLHRSQRLHIIWPTSFVQSIIYKRKRNPIVYLDGIWQT